MKFCVWGAGSIGTKHFSIIQELGHECCYITKRDMTEKSYPNLKEALEDFGPDVIIVANETAKHFDSLVQINSFDFKGKVLVEKPVFDVSRSLKDLKKETIENTFVLYNIRQNVGLQFLKKVLESEELIDLHVYVGQYLPQWRKGVDYRNSYSAKKELGGGVLRDLSHELDYTLWLLEDVVSVFGTCDHASHLEITSEDSSVVILRNSKKKVANVSLNYLNKTARRFVIMNTHENTYELDLVENKILKNGDDVMLNFSMQETYRKQIELISTDDFSNFTTLEEGLRVVEIFEAVESSSKEGKVIKL